MAKFYYFVLWKTTILEDKLRIKGNKDNPRDKDNPIIWIQLQKKEDLKNRDDQENEDDLKDEDDDDDVFLFEVTLHIQPWYIIMNARGLLPVEDWLLSC